MFLPFEPSVIDITADVGEGVSFKFKRKSNRKIQRQREEKYQTYRDRRLHLFSHCFLFFEKKKKCNNE